MICYLTEMDRPVQNRRQQPLGRHLDNISLNLQVSISPIHLGVWLACVLCKRNRLFNFSKKERPLSNELHTLLYLITTSRP